MHDARHWWRTAATAEVRTAWRRRVFRVGSLIQLAFAALWLGRGMLATDVALRLPLAVGLVVGTLSLGVWWAIRTAGVAPKPTGQGAAQLERVITVATVVQLAASFALPAVATAAGRPDLIVTTVAMTIGLLLLWLCLTLGMPGHAAAGTLLLVVPIGLALVLAGDTLTAASGFATGAILVATALIGLQSLPAPAEMARHQRSIVLTQCCRHAALLPGCSSQCSPATGVYNRATSRETR